MNKSILVMLGILIIGVAYYVLSGDVYRKITHEETSALQKFKGIDFDKVARLTIAKGKAEPVKLEKTAEGWVVASAYGAPAEKEKVEKIVDGLKKLTGASLEVAGKSTAGHEDFQVDEVRGGVIRLFPASGDELGRIVIGDTAKSPDFQTTKVYARFGDDAVTYRVESNLRSDASLYGKLERASFIDKKPLTIPDDDEAFEARLIRSGKPDLLVERRFKDVPVEKKPDEKKEAETTEGAAPAETAEGGEPKPEEKKAETKKEEYFVVTSEQTTTEVGESEKWTAKGVLDRLKSLRIDDVAEPKDPKEYGLDAPQLKVVTKFRKKDKPDSEVKEVAVAFGNAIKDDKGEDKSYYFVIEGEKFKGRFYTVDKWSFTSSNKELKDFQPKKEEKKDDAKPEAPNAAETPAAPAPGTSPTSDQPAPGPVVPPEAPESKGPESKGTVPPQSEKPTDPPAQPAPPNPPAQPAPPNSAGNVKPADSPSPPSDSRP